MSGGIKRDSISKDLRKTVARQPIALNPFTLIRRRLIQRRNPDFLEFIFSVVYISNRFNHE